MEDVFKVGSSRFQNGLQRNTPLISNRENDIQCATDISQQTQSGTCVEPLIVYDILHTEIYCMTVYVGCLVCSLVSATCVARQLVQ
eukprot:5186668-Amphidinium_carterae.1